MPFRKMMGKKTAMDVVTVMIKLYVEKRHLSAICSTPYC